MLRVTATALVVLLAAAGCTSTNGSGGTSVVEAPAGNLFQELAGTWTGSLDSGESVRVRISESGTVSYAFQGTNVPVTNSRVSGRSIVLTVGAGGGRVTLQPSGDGLSYRYSFRGNRAATTLTRS